VRVAVLTISDACAAGTRSDASGDAVVQWARLGGFTLAGRDVVPDETVEIVRRLLAWCDADVADLVFTTGGTGLSPRDHTPEATLAVLERQAPGIAERMRAVELERFPRSALSRAVAGSRGRTLIVNLPGSPGGVRDALAALEPIVRHAVEIVRGDPTDHSPAVA
jgi:molybdenum cofactor synthesis domain-containing protein